jgi:hypothetical protein
MKENEIAKSQIREVHRVNSESIRHAAANVRATLRYALQTEVEFRWTGADGGAKDGRGQTRDISQKGAYVEASSFPPNGAIVKLSISLPPALESGKVVRMEARGRVVRVETERRSHGASGGGFAVVNEQVNLCGG